MIRVKFGTREPVPYTAPEMPSVPVTVTASGIIIAEAEDSESNRSFICDAAVLMLTEIIGQYSGIVRSSYIHSKKSEMNKLLSEGLERRLHFKCSVSLSAVNVNRDDGDHSVLPVPSAGNELPSARAKFCPNCGGVLAGGGKFCPNCGKPV